MKVAPLLEFANGGAVQGPMTITGPALRGRTGTTVTFWPDGSILEETEFRAQTITERLQVMAFLNRALEIRFSDERSGGGKKETFKYNGGIVDYVKHLNASKESLFKKVGSYQQAEDTQEVDVALEWNTGFHEGIFSFANGISTTEGGMHEEGFKKALTNVVNLHTVPQHAEGEERTSTARTSARDLPHRVVRLKDPQFEGRPRRSSATSRSGRWSNGRQMRSSLNGSKRTLPKPTRS